MAGDGDHYRIAFDKPNTWSQKYNLVWDKLLGLDVFPPEVARQEVAYYKKRPPALRRAARLSRTQLTKTDWCLWSATLADDRGDFEAIVSPIYDYLNDTTARLPFVDSYVHRQPQERRHACPPGDRRRVHQDAGRPGDVEEVGGPRPVPARRLCARPDPAAVSPSSCRPRASDRSPGGTRPSRPSDDWTQPGFDDSGWKRGPRRVRHRRTPRASGSRPAGTRPTSGCGARSRCPPRPTPPASSSSLYHDEDVEIYIDGILAARESGLRHDLPARRDRRARPRASSSRARRSSWPFTATRRAAGRGSTWGWWTLRKASKRFRVSSGSRPGP